MPICVVSEGHELAGRKKMSAAEIIDFFINTIDLFKNTLRFGRRKIAPTLALKEPDSERFLGVSNSAANSRCRHIQKLGRPADGACDHDRPEVDLAPVDGARFTWIARTDKSLGLLE